MPTDDDFEDDRPRRPRNSRDDFDDEPPARRRRDPDDYDDLPRRPAGPGNGLAITSLVLGIISIVMVCCCAYISPLTGIGALITGFMANSKGQSKGMAITGIILGALGAIGAIVLIILAFSGAIQPMDIRKFQK